RVEPSLLDAPLGARYQFERQGYFCVDSKDSSSEQLVFNRTVSLKDSWAKIQSKDAKQQSNNKRNKKQQNKQQQMPKT
ncbi:MAG TPA: hypothetical protein DCY79_01145, partial [Planctomycetaceae bacterium]|nr:hypothetical protein [Planctomycetaceae bacterium]